MMISAVGDSSAQSNVRRGRIVHGIKIISVLTMAEEKRSRTEQSVERIKACCVISVEDDGAGASEEEIEKLNHAPHYMVCDTNTREQRHGLGLLIVKQIAETHGGKVEIGKSGHGGFGVKIMLPLDTERKKEQNKKRNFQI